MAVGERSAPGRPVEEAEAAPKEPVTLAELVQRARNSSDEERRWLSGLVLEALEKIPEAASPERDRLVQQLLTFLDDEALHGLVAPNGVACRAAAIDAVLRVGYPWALQLEPEDVEFFRTQKPAFDKSGVAVKAGAAVAGAASLVTLAASVAHGPSLPLWLTDRLKDPIDLAILVGLVSAIAGAAPVLTSPPATRSHQLGRGLMLLAGVALFAGLVADGFSSGLTYLHSVFLVPALGAALAGLLPRK